MSPFVLPAEITALLERLRRRIRQYVLWEGLALVIVAFGTIFWASFLVDWAYFQLTKLELPRAFRFLCLLGMLGALTAVLLTWVVFRLVRSFQSRALALVLERRFPELDDRLITAVEAAEGRQAVEGRFAEPMLNHTIREAARLADKLELESVFDWRPLRRAVTIAALFIVSVLGLMAIDSAAMDRWVHGFLGLEETYWPRNTRLTVQVLLQPGDRIREFERHHYRHPRGSDLTLVIKAADGAVWPERVKLDYRMAQGRGGGQPYLKRTGDQSFIHTIPGLLDDLEIWVSGNDYASPVPYRVEVVEPPHVDAVSLECLYAAYTGLNRLEADQPVRTSISVQGVQVSLPMETDFLLKVQTNKPLRAFRVEGDVAGARFDLAFGRHAGSDESASGDLGFVTRRSSPESPEIKVPWPAERLPEIWSADQQTVVIPLTLPQAGVERLWEQLSQSLETGALPLPLSLPPDVALKIHLEDADGIPSTEPARLTIQGIVDEPPRIESELRGIGSAITRKARIPIAGLITDDYGVASARFDYKVDAAEEWEPREFAAAPADAKEFRLQRDDQEAFERFDVLPLDLSIRQKLTLSVWAEDRDNLNGPHQTRGQKYEFTIVPVEELLSILFAKELNLRKRFEQIIEEVKGTQKDLELHRGKIEQRRKLASASKPAEHEEELTSLAQAISACAERSLYGIRKNATETAGVETSFREIREELVNNNAETLQMLERLELQIIEPLSRINRDSYPEIDGTLGLFRLANERGEDAQAVVDDAIAEAASLVRDLEQVLQEMQELEHFHKLLENLKEMITDQQELIDKTKNRRKQNLIKGLE